MAKRVFQHQFIQVSGMRGIPGNDVLYFLNNQVAALLYVCQQLWLRRDNARFLSNGRALFYGGHDPPLLLSLAVVSKNRSVLTDGCTILALWRT